MRVSVDLQTIAVAVINCVWGTGQKQNKALSSVVNNLNIIQDKLLCFYAGKFQILEFQYILHIKSKF